MNVLIILATFPLFSSASQMSFSADSSRATVSPRWEALGPFPLGTRELPYLSSPLAAFTRPGQTEEGLFLGLDFAPGPSEWPSSFCVDGNASWARFERDSQGWVEIGWDQVDWQQRRRTEGWAALQYLTLLRTTLSITSDKSRVPVNLDLTQAHSFAIIPKGDDLISPDHTVRWHTGDIYAYSEQQAPKGPFPSKLAGWVEELEPGEYWVMVRGLFEIRMFGDPEQAIPKIKFRFEAQTQSSAEATTLLGVDDAQVGVPDVVDGRFFGEFGGISLRAGEHPLFVDGISLTDPVKGLTISLLAPTVPLPLGPYQTRPLTFLLEQTSPIAVDLDSVLIRVDFSSLDGGRPHPHRLTVKLPLQHRRHWTTSPSTYVALRYTFLDYDRTAQYAMALPPLVRLDGRSKAVILATHGAGVEASAPMWTEALGERREGLGWIVFATGKTPWGYDWHGPSAEHAFSARRALPGAVDKLRDTRADIDGWEVSEAMMLVGHSNGGQGAMYLLERYPDMFVGAIAAAGYLKIQSYVAFSQWASSHFVDPSLWGILQSSLTSFDNDLQASNAAHVPLMLVHGTEDENVPVWHSRELKALVDRWTGNTSSVLLQEIPNGKHWFDGIVSSPEVRSFLDQHLSLAGPPQEAYWKHGFTLTVASVDESGSKGGWRISEIDQPGRLARLKVSPLADNDAHTQRVKTTNARRLTFTRPPTSDFPSSSAVTTLHLDSTVLTLPTNLDSININLTFFRPSPSSSWVILDDLSARTLPPSAPRVSGPIIRILTSDGPLLLVVPSLDDPNSHETSIAKRIAHDAFVYARLDAEILSAEEAERRVKMEGGKWAEGSMVVIGGGGNAFARRLGETPVSFPRKDVFSVSLPTGGERVFDPITSPSTGLLSLHPHPTNPRGLALHLAGTDAKGLERAYRMFPVRTGTPLPDWMVLGPDADWKGAGGVDAAGFWGPSWEYSSAMSWTSD